MFTNSNSATTVYSVPNCNIANSLHSLMAQPAGMQPRSFTIERQEVEKLRVTSEFTRLTRFPHFELVERDLASTLLNSLLRSNICESGTYLVGPGGVGKSSILLM